MPRGVRSSPADSNNGKPSVPNGKAGGMSY